MQHSISVGLGEIKISDNVNDVLIAYGLGSCLGIGMYDPQANLAGMLHAVLPSHSNGRGERSAKYVDSGLEIMLDLMKKNGGSLYRVQVRMAGGANMLQAPGFGNSFDIGARNIDSALDFFKKRKIKLLAKEVGGHHGRTVRLYVANGRMTMRSMGQQEVDL